MPTAAVEEFAKALVRQVRDAALRSCDRQLSPSSRTPVGARWREASAGGADNNAVRTVLPDCVDETLFYLLQAIDQGVLRLSYTDESGQVVDLTEAGLGELSGWYMGSGGWRARYSQERFVDDFGDLRADGGT